MTLKEKVEKRAFELFSERGGIHGYAIEDWLKAEKELLSQKAETRPVAQAKKKATVKAKKKTK